MWRPRGATVVVAMCLVVIVVVGTDIDTTTSVQEDVLQKPAAQEEQEVPGSRGNGTKDSRQTWKKCFQKFSHGCAKLLLTRLADHLPQARLQIAPGITLQANSSQSLELVDLVTGLVANPLTAATGNVHLLGKMRQFLEAVTVSVQLEDPALLHQVKTLSEEVVEGIVSTGESEGRKKGYGGALLWSAGALAAVGFASLAAVAGKAMMASLMALMLAGMTALRGTGGGGGDGGGGSKYSNVEIIKAPAHYELAPAPHYEGGHAFEHDHYYTAPAAAAAYEYGRKMTVSHPRGDNNALVKYKTASTQ